MSRLIWFLLDLDDVILGQVKIILWAEKCCMTSKMVGDQLVTTRTDLFSLITILQGWFSQNLNMNQLLVHAYTTKQDRTLKSMGRVDYVSWYEAETHLTLSTFSFYSFPSVEHGITVTNNPTVLNLVHVDLNI